MSEEQIENWIIEYWEYQAYDCGKCEHYHKGSTIDKGDDPSECGVIESDFEYNSCPALKSYLNGAYLK